MEDKKPSQLGINAVWSGPYKATNLAKGNARNHMQVSKSECPYTAGPISSIAQK
jgi:hypothetical protein|tara:strand:+ start:477 stop:638 length:162 start_codon:yes stop_codon:yes gene_type:complete